MADSVVLLDDREWRRFLRGMRDKLRDPFALLKLGAMTYGFQDIIDHFRQEQGSEGSWAKRKPSTQRSYARMGKYDRRYSPSNRLLQLTGKLRGSLLPTKGGIKRQGRYGALMFSSSPVGIFHQKGTRKMVKRDFMWLNDPAQQRMVDLILSRVVGE